MTVRGDEVVDHEELDLRDRPSVDPLLTDVTYAEAAYVYRMARDQARWITRRTVHVVFDSAISMRRTVTCEIQLTEQDLISLPTVAGRVPLQIAGFEPDFSRPLTAMQVGTGEIPTLRTASERTVMARGLAGDVAPEGSAELPDVEFYALRSIDRGRPSPQLSEHVSAESVEAKLLIAIKDVEPVEYLIVLVERPEKGCLFNLSFEVSETLPARDENFREYATLLKANRNLRYDRLKFGRTWGIHWWVPDTFTLRIPLTDLLACRSYHAELVSPAGTYVCRGSRLEVIAVDPADGSVSVITHAIDKDPRPDSAHFHFAVEREREGLPTSAVAQMLVVLQPTFHDGMRIGQNMSAVSLLSLVFLTATLGFRSWGYENDSVVTFLLVAPAIVVAAMVRSNEPSLTKKVLSYYRARVSLVGVAMFATALAIAVKTRGAALTLVLCLAIAVTLFTSIPTFISAHHAANRDPDETEKSHRRSLNWLRDRLIGKLIQDLSQELGPPPDDSETSLFGRVRNFLGGIAEERAQNKFQP
jgi:hypothetical protein